MKNKVGLGTFPLVGVFNTISKKKAEYVVRKFLDEGGYYIDTAPMYGNGEIEKLLGKVLKGIPRNNYYLITKTVYNIDNNGKLYKNGKYDDVIGQIDNVLKRLNVDYVDQLMVHSPDKATPIEETLRALEKIQKDGKARDLGVSNVDLMELTKFNKNGNIKYVENRFSLINRSISVEFENYLLTNNICLIPYHLLEIGLLTGNALDKNFKLRNGDMRNSLPYWNLENQRIIFEWVKQELAPLAKEIGCTIGQLNIAWALKQKIIDFVIVGTTKAEYLSLNLKANDIHLSNDILKRMEKAYQSFEKMVNEKYHKTVREFRGLNEKYY